MVLKSCLVLLCLPAVVWAQSIRALWVSPDWLLAGDRSHDDAEVRRIAVDTVNAAVRLGANAIFLESLLRGQSIAPCGSGVGALPVYPLTRWNYRVEGAKIHDLLTIFIDEGRARGVEVHAWVHCLYWKSDNEAFRRPWQDGPTIFDDHLQVWLQKVAAGVRSIPRRRAAAQLSRALAGGFSWAGWSGVLRRWCMDNFEGSFNNFVRFVEAGGGPPPEFLVTNPGGELHYGMEQDRILAIYVNPEHPPIAARVVWAIRRLVATHPGLAGVHLDHVRYPKGPFGSPGAFDRFPAVMKTLFCMPNRWEVREDFDRFVSRREATITALVRQIKAALPGGMPLTAAVHPAYHRERDDRTGPVRPEAFMAQDWSKWPVDLAIPMIYNASGGHVEHVLGQARGAAAGSGVRLAPGVSSRDLIRSYGRSRSWVLFDLDGLVDLVPGIPGSALKRMGLGERMF